MKHLKKTKRYSRKKTGGNYVAGNKRTRNNRTRKIKPLNCHPKRMGTPRKNIANSCFTPDTINVIKNAYNKHHSNKPEKKIHTNDPNEIRDKLLEKNPHCEQEICLLKQIPNEPLRLKMQQELFTPIQPAEWRHKPNAWLSNYDIDAVIQQYEKEYPEFAFLGPTPIDFDTIKHGKCVLEELCHLQLSKLYRSGKRKIGIIYNLDTSDGPGTHWVSMFLDLGDHKPFLFYFNSTADNMPEEVAKLVQRIRDQWMKMPKRVRKGRILEEYKSDGKTEHQHSNTECGMYSLFFIITCLTRRRGGMESSSELSKSDLLHYFMGTHRISDEYMQQFRNIYFTPL